MKRILFGLILAGVITSCKTQKPALDYTSDASQGRFVSANKNATRIAITGGGGSHDFKKYFGIEDGKVLSNNGENTVLFTEDVNEMGTLIPAVDILMLTNNQPLSDVVKNSIFTQVDAGKLDMLIYHPSTWYNWQDWPKYNKELVGGGSRSHENLGEFEVIVTQPNHPIMKGVPTTFRIVDELYRWEDDPQGTDVEVLAIGKGLESGEEFPVVWIVKHPKAKIVGNTLGHDERAHGLQAYKTILKNSFDWINK